MGLAIARAILVAHGGGIEASSVPGKGASFRFWVPLVEKEPVIEGAGERAEVQARAKRGSVEKLQRVLSKVSDAPPEAMDRM
jgi:hypothetical protein